MSTYDSYLVQEEDGASQFVLEDGSGNLLLETASVVVAAAPGRSSPFQFQRVTEDEDAIAAVLALL